MTWAAHREAFAADEEAVAVYDVLASREPELYGETHRRALAELRRALELAGDRAASARLHLGRPRIANEPPRGGRPGPPAGTP